MAEMSPEAALAVLIQHNAWRRGAEIPAQEPKTIGEAIDVTVSHIAVLQARCEALEADAERYAYVIARHPLAFQRLVTGTTASGPVHRKDLIDAAIDTARKESEG